MLECKDEILDFLKYDSQDQNTRETLRNDVSVLRWRWLCDSCTAVQRTIATCCQQI